MSTNLILFPFNGNSREALDVVLCLNKCKEQWTPLCFLDDDIHLSNQSYHNLPVETDRQVLINHSDASILAVPGSPHTFLKRKEIIESLNVDAKRFVSFIHPSANISSSATIGKNTLIMANVVISAGVSIGDHCIILPNTVISHESVVKDYCCIGSNVSISGDVEIQESCYIGSGVSIRQSIKVAKHSLVGIGSNVINDVKESCVVAGNPAKLIK